MRVYLLVVVSWTVVLFSESLLAQEKVPPVPTAPPQGQAFSDEEEKNAFKGLNDALLKKQALEKRQEPMRKAAESARVLEEKVQQGTDEISKMEQAVRAAQERDFYKRQLPFLIFGGVGLVAIVIGIIVRMSRPKAGAV